MNFRYIRRVLLLLMLIIGGASASAAPGASPKEEKKNKPRKGSLAWYINGPQKDWSQRDYKTYYKWRQKVYDRVAKRSSPDDGQLLRRQKAIINGNKITTEIWNFGSISSPGNRTTDIVWEGLGYGYEFGPFIVAEVEVTPYSHVDAFPATDENGALLTRANGDTIWHAIVISDGLVSNGGEVSPDGLEFWGWEPLAYSDENVPFANPLSARIPTSNDIDRDGDGKPDSWPEGWYNPNLKEYVWPGALQQGASNAELEAFFVVDDRKNKEFEYYPFLNDSTRRGLGIEIESRYYQWSNPLAEDIIFLVYRVRNKSDKDLENVFFGMWGDPHIGGPSNWPDDLAGFDTELNMVFAWDEDGISDIAGKKPGYFGYKFLESPGNPDDGIDNDGDGLIDESQDNGIDDDGDWDPEKDDIGVDGVPNTGDRGEKDGLPTAGTPFDIREPGEPNFEWTDLDESDQNGLTSFAAPPFSGNRISDDDKIWRRYMQPGFLDTSNAVIAGDNVFLYGSGPITLRAGEARRFSIALIVGQDRQDLFLNAQTAQLIFERNYQFAKPPEKPTVTAVPGDRKVTLYWDQVAETETFDPLSGENDFEGYVIYRSTDPNFQDQQVITDANGSSFLFEPLKTADGGVAKFDLVNEFFGLSSIPFSQRGTVYNLGNNTGLRHSFIDSNNVINGQTYYYAVVSYDHGSDSLQIPPAEVSKTITLNPEMNEVILDVNTKEVIPRAPVAGYEPGYLEDNGGENNVAHVAGIATGALWLDILHADRMEEGNQFRVFFEENPARYSVEDMSAISRTVRARLDQFVSLPEKHVNPETFALTPQGGGAAFAPGVDFELNAENGQFRAIPGGSIDDLQSLTATYRYFPVRNSRNFSSEESNPIFDGMKLFVQDQPLELDPSRTRWTSTSGTNLEVVVKPFNNLERNKYPADYEIRFSDSIVDSSSQPRRGYIKTKFQVFEVTRGKVPAHQRMVIVENSATRDSLWSPGERVIILQGDEGLSGTWEFTMLPPASGAPVLPQGGDVFFIATTRPFSAEDEYTFTTRASRINEEKAANELSEITVVPNPYVVTNVIEPLDRQNPRDRGQRRLYFNHLPARCTIRIFTITGELVDVLEHDSGIDDGKEFWTLTTRDNFPVAYGVYIYHVDAGSLGEKIGRFAVIK